MYHHPTHTAEELSELAAKFNASLKPSYEDLERQLAEIKALMNEYKEVIAWLDGVARYAPEDAEVRRQVGKTIDEMTYPAKSRVDGQIQIWNT